MANSLRWRGGRARVVVVSAIALMSVVSASGRAVAGGVETGGGLPGGMVAAIARDLGLDAGEYLRRAETAQRLSVFAAAMRERYPGAVTGARLDGRGRGEVAVRPEAEAARAAVLAAGFAPADEGGGDVAGVEPVDLPSADDSTANPPVPQVTGGDRFVTDSGAGCSWAFNAIDAEGNPAAVTAGHCDAATEAEDRPAPGERGTHELTPGLKIGARNGVFEESVMDGVRDYALVRIADADRDSFRNNLIRTADGTLPITGVGIPVVGEPVCKSGATTGFTCGIILAVDQPDPQRPPIRFTHTALSLPGDSGGALVSGTLAMGIVSRGGYTDDPTEFPADKPGPVRTPPLPSPLDQIVRRILAGGSRADFERISPLADSILRAHPQLTMIAQSVADVVAENPGLEIRTS